MNFKTLAYLTEIPYTTLTNSKNREDSISSADVALRISMVLNKPIEMLLGDDVFFSGKKFDTTVQSRNIHDKYLFKKYENLISNLEKCSPAVQDSICRMIQAVCER